MNPARAAERSGEPARLRLSPPLEYFMIENRVRTMSVGETKIQLERMQGSRQLRIWGTIPARSATSRLIAVDDPAEFAAGGASPPRLRASATRRRVTASREQPRIHSKIVTKNNKLFCHIVFEPQPQYRLAMNQKLLPNLK